jgi:DNA-binding MarR family transcriptional regulator
MAAMARQLGYQVKRLQQALRARMDGVLAEHGLTMPQYAVLAQLAKRPGISNADLARLSFVTPPTMIRIVTTLEELGLLSRVDRPTEGRARAAQLSATGKQRLAAASADVDAVEAVLWGATSDADRPAVSAWLATAAERLEADRRGSRFVPAAAATADRPRRRGDGATYRAGTQRELLTAPDRPPAGDMLVPRVHHQ